MVAALHLVAVYFGTAGFCLWLVHRFVREMSKTAAVWLLVLPLVLPGAALFQGKVYAPMDLLYEHPPWSDLAVAHEIEPRPSFAGDLPFQIVPWHQAVRDAWSAGDWPLWNPYMLSGDLLAGSAQPAPFHPLNLLSLLLPLDLSLTYQAAGMLFLAALGGFLFCRELRCGDPASLVGAASWMLCGFVVFWLIWPMAAAVATMPWIAAGIQRLPRFGLLTTGLALLLLSGHPESMLHVVATGCTYGLFVIVQRVREGGLTRRQRSGKAVEIVLAACLAGLIAGGLAAIHLLPIVEALPETAMYELRHTQFAHQDHSVPWLIARERMLTVALPFRFGISWQTTTLQAPGFFVPMSSAYIGSVALGLALLGLWRSAGRARFSFAAWAAVGVAAGAGAPGITHAMAALPLFDLSIHRRWVFAAAWALSTLAALGVEWVIRREQETPGGSVRDLSICLGASTMLATALLWENWGEMRSPAEGPGLDAAFLIRNSSLLLGPPLLGILGLLGAKWFARRTRDGGSVVDVLGSRRVAWLLLALVVAQRGAESAGRFPTLDRDDAFPEVPLLSVIPDRDEPERVVGIDFTFLANTSAYYGLEDVRGYQPMSSRLYTETFFLWDSKPEMFFNQVEDIDSPFLDFLGVRWAIAPTDLRAADGWRRVDGSPSIQLMENADALPRAFLPDRLLFDAPDPRSKMKDIRDFSELAIVDTLMPDRPGGRALSNGRGRVHAFRDGTGLRISAEMEDSGWVVVSQPRWHGWRAVRTDADGRRVELPVYGANHAFLALQLPPGSSEVELFFSPTSFRIGRAMTFATLLLLVTASLVTRRMRTES